MRRECALPGHLVVAVTVQAPYSLQQAMTVVEYLRREQSRAEQPDNDAIRHGAMLLLLLLLTAAVVEGRAQRPW